MVIEIVEDVYSPYTNRPEEFAIASNRSSEVNDPAADKPFARAIPTIPATPSARRSGVASAVPGSQQRVRG